MWRYGDIKGRYVYAEIECTSGEKFRSNYGKSETK